MVSPEASWIVEIGYIRQLNNTSSRNLTAWSWVACGSAASFAWPYCRLKAANGRTVLVANRRAPTFSGLTGPLPHFGSTYDITGWCPFRPVSRPEATGLSPLLPSFSPRKRKSLHRESVRDQTIDIQRAGHPRLAPNRPSHRAAADWNPSVRGGQLDRATRRHDPGNHTWRLLCGAFGPARLAGQRSRSPDLIFCGGAGSSAWTPIDPRTDGHNRDTR